MLSFKLFAGTNVGLRENNEDNFIVCPDLIQNEWIVPANQLQEHPLGKRGCVMVVADGMGGQNAGEVASAIAIETMKELFSPDKMPADVLDKPDSIKSFLKEVICEADLRVKKQSEECPETYGMGSTIVIAWLLGNKLYVAWLGDSRAYSFIPNKGIGRLSKDHSYVQQLVDSGALTDEEAMNHPNSNVITRSLGDTSQKAKADVAEYDVVDGEIILLCSDGLCGVCPDAQIGGIIEAEQADLARCKERLTTAALAAGGSDNITISLLQISSDKKCMEDADGEKQESSTNKRIPFVDVFATVFGVCLLGALFYAIVSICKREVSQDSSPEMNITLSLCSDTLKSGEGVRYQVSMEGTDTTYTFLYDNHILRFNQKNNTISLRKLVLKDTTMQIVVVCDADSAIRDSAVLYVVSDFIIAAETPQQEEKINVREEVTKNITGNNTNSITLPDSITKSLGKAHDESDPIRTEKINK